MFDRYGHRSCYRLAPVLRFLQLVVVDLDCHPQVSQANIPIDPLQTATRTAVLLLPINPFYYPLLKNIYCSVVSLTRTCI